MKDKENSVNRVIRPLIKPFFASFAFLTLLAGLATLASGTIIGTFFALSCALLSIVGLIAIVIYMAEAAAS